MPESTTPVLRLQGLRKSYNVGQPNAVEVLHGLDMSLARHDFAALVGASGSGKSTLLNIIGLLDVPTAGELFLLGEPTRDMDDARFDRDAVVSADMRAGAIAHRELDSVNPAFLDLPFGSLSSRDHAGSTCQALGSGRMSFSYGASSS